MVAAPTFHTDRNQELLIWRGRAQITPRGLQQELPCAQQPALIQVVLQSPRRVAELPQLAELGGGTGDGGRHCPGREHRAVPWGAKCAPHTGHTAHCPPLGHVLPGACPALAQRVPAVQRQLGERGKAPTSAAPAEPTWQNL